MWYLVALVVVFLIGMVTGAMVRGEPKVVYKDRPAPTSKTRPAHARRDDELSLLLFGGPSQPSFISAAQAWDQREALKEQLETRKLQLKMQNIELGYFFSNHVHALKRQVNLTVTPPASQVIPRGQIWIIGPDDRGYCLVYDGQEFTRTRYKDVVHAGFNPKWCIAEVYRGV
jgi:hypothetical protein